MKKELKILGLLMNILIFVLVFKNLVEYTFQKGDLNLPLGLILISIIILVESKLLFNQIKSLK